MRLTIKDPRARVLAGQLADLTGESLTTAVIQALEAKLEQARPKRGVESMAERILAFANRFARGMPQDCRSCDHGSQLFGEDGLPR